MEDEFLRFYRQYRPKDALPHGWKIRDDVAPFTCPRRDSCSKDSGRSSADISDEIAHEEDAQTAPSLYNSPWEDSVDKDSGFSSITTAAGGSAQVSPSAEPAEAMTVWEGSVDWHHPCLEESNSTEPDNVAVKRMGLFSVLMWVFLIMAYCRSPARQLQRDNHGRAFDLKALAHMINSSVIGQDLAMRQVWSFVNEINERPKRPGVHLGVLFGSSGTGKSLAVQLLRDSFLHPDNIIDLPQLNVIEPNGKPLLLIAENAQFHYVNRLIDHFERNRPEQRFVILATSQIGGSSLLRQSVEWLKMSKLHKINLTMIQNVLVQDQVDFYNYLRPTASLILLPFLPLTRDQVKQCIQRQAWAQNRALLSVDDVRLILRHTDFSAESFPAFATRGCKMVEKQVQELLLHKGQAAATLYE